MNAAEKAGISWPLPKDCNNEMLMELLFPEERQKTALYVLPDYPYIHAELARKGVNLTMLWEEYCTKCQSEGNVPYMYTQYCEKYRQWARVTKATMRIQHKPGDSMEVDWAGATLDIHDPVTGEVSKAYLFVAVLPCSCFTYAEACDDMKLENWINCHVHAYNYFGGVTRLLVPDNLKTGIAKNTRSETVLNRTYQEMSEHYNTASELLPDQRQGTGTEVQILCQSDEASGPVWPCSPGEGLPAAAVLFFHALHSYTEYHPEKWTRSCADTA
ncbi:DDE-type integrase/transposase/recombinase [Flavonifractor sp. An91]|uniref:DDE-type integrase/transposase/recombinase n=1 Tax=Flavonifractor sp. An91 TaxID=1965665 RepID=UPI0013A61627|nr:DDE-type integrase/transposase/recombinase [Flavonifractor sp. An91]